MAPVIVVKAAYDPEAAVWHTESIDVHGLRIESSTLEVLLERVPGAVRDLLECEGHLGGLDISIEVIAHASTRVRIPEKA